LIRLYIGSKVLYTSGIEQAIYYLAWVAIFMTPIGALLQFLSIISLLFPPPFFFMPWVYTQFIIYFIVLDIVLGSIAVCSFVLYIPIFKSIKNGQYAKVNKIMFLIAGILAVIGCYSVILGVPMLVAAILLTFFHS
jgi:hypothetical protein